MQANAKTYDSWTGSVDSDTDMGNSHYVSWQGLIDKMTEKDLSDKSILDFGCNQGGFLRYLYQQRPFAKAVGMDLAAQTVASANARISVEPIRYIVSGNPADAQEKFDIIFSHEVVYLLPDLAQHAHDIADALNDGGVYYIALGAHTDNPMWPRWHKLISAFSPVPPQNYSVEDIARSFHENGFIATAQKMPCTGFLQYKPNATYYNTFYEKLTYYIDNFVLFRMQKRRV